MTTKLVLFAAITVFARHAFCADKLKTDIICSKVGASGEADNRLSILIQSHPTAWTKRILVVENGYLGSQVIGSFQVPVDQPMVSTPSFFEDARIATFQARGFDLQMEVADPKGLQALGPAHGRIQLRGYQPLETELKCKNIN